MWVFRTVDDSPVVVEAKRYREDLLEGSTSKDQGAVDILKIFTAAEWAAVIALDTTTVDATVQVDETVPFPPAGER
jgi:hypothetical protein